MSVWIAYACAAVGVLVGIWGFWLAFQWQDRAERAEDEYRTVAGQLGLSESDNQELVESQQKLAAEKAAIEDERVALETEKEQLEEQGRELSETLDLVAQVARKYNECSVGYSKVIEDLAADTVTDATVQTANAADAACTEAARLASRLR
ncbi:MAG: hypothetical protein IT198_06410 [Acidimicrobiia bacterium]|nr:hypothetical protein [Acidimicrobiia bacterium]